MSYRRVSVIMAGGAGERFWPVSTRTKPKQFLRLSSPDRSLITEAVDRAAALFGNEATYIVTGEHLVEATKEECPNLPEANVMAEPCKRNTAGCLVWAAAQLIASDPDGWSQTSVAVLTADHRIAPEAAFHDTVRRALETAERTGGLVTIGVRPDRPETGYGYIETGEPDGEASAVRRFREKPDLATAQGFLASGGFLWNAGMFFWTLPAFVAEMEQADPGYGAAVREIAGYLGSGREAEARAAFEALPSVSIDYALMEKARRVFVVEAGFEWDDLGSWDSLARSYPGDDAGNVNLGPTRVLEGAGNVVYNVGPGQEVCLLGVEGLVVVVTDGVVMVCPKERSQDVRRFSQS